jgi:hypothetical protein
MRQTMVNTAQQEKNTSVSPAKRFLKNLLKIFFYILNQSHAKDGDDSSSSVEHLENAKPEEVEI